MLLHVISTLIEFFNYRIRKHEASFGDEYLSILDRSMCGKRHCTLRGFASSVISSMSISRGKFLYADDIGPSRRCMTTPWSCLYRLLASFGERSTTKLVSSKARTYRGLLIRRNSENLTPRILDNRKINSRPSARHGRDHHDQEHYSHHRIDQVNQRPHSNLPHFTRLTLQA